MSLCHATRTGTMLTHHRHRPKLFHHPSSKRRQFLLFSCLLLLLHFLTSMAITTVHCKSCFAQLSANDLFLNSLRFSTGLSSKFTNGFFAMDRGSDIEFVQPTTSTSVEEEKRKNFENFEKSEQLKKFEKLDSYYGKSHFIICPVPRSINSDDTSMICNKSMIDLGTAEKLADEYAFQYDQVPQSIYTTIRIDPSNPNVILIGKYHRQHLSPVSTVMKKYGADGGGNDKGEKSGENDKGEKALRVKDSNLKQFQPMRDEVMKSLEASSQKSTELLFEPLVGHIYLFNISRSISFNLIGSQSKVSKSSSSSSLPFFLSSSLLGMWQNENDNADNENGNGNDYGDSGIDHDGLMSEKRELSAGDHSKTLFTYDIVKMMVVNMVGTTISIRWDVLYSSSGQIMDCMIEGDAKFSVKLGESSLNVLPTVMGAHVAVFISVTVLCLCVISLFIYQIFSCKCWNKNKYYALD